MVWCSSCRVEFDIKGNQSNAWGCKDRRLLHWSLVRRSGTTRMFQGGIDRKIIKEVTGHRSDAIDAYQITSAEQKQRVSDVIAHKPSSTCVSDTKEMSEKSKPECIDNIRVASTGVTSDVGTEYSKVNVDRLGNMVNEIVNRNVKKGTTKIKIEIEITHE